VAKDPWLVPVATLRRTLGASRREQRVGKLGRLEVAGTVVGEDSEACADVVLCSLEGGVEVSGTVAAHWEGYCRRCLIEVTGLVEADVRELYRQRRRREVSGDDDETYPLDSEMLDLRPLVRDALLLELPLAPVCRDDCAGLCAVCGANLNEGPCACGHSSWSDG